VGVPRLDIPEREWGWGPDPLKGSILGPLREGAGILVWGMFKSWNSLIMMEEHGGPPTPDSRGERGCGVSASR
jgi:hypothetical protein